MKPGARLLENGGRALAFQAQKQPEKHTFSTDARLAKSAFNDKVHRKIKSPPIRPLVKCVVHSYLGYIYKSARRRPSSERIMLRRRARTLDVIAVLALGLAPIAAMAEETPAAPAASQTLPSIVVAPVEEKSLVDLVVATGTIKAVEEIYVQPQVEGLQISTLGADAGDEVKEGQVLATLSTDSLVLQKGQLEASRAQSVANVAQLQAQLLEARASADEATSQRNRAVTLNAKGSVSTAAAEQAEATAKSAQARLKAAEQGIVAAEAGIKVIDAQLANIELNLTRAEIKAPATGLIATRTAKVGAIASASGQPLFTLIRAGEVELVADVTESDILKIKPGQKAKIRVAGSSEPLTGSVRLVSPTVDQTTRLGSVRIAVDEDAKARAGMYGTAEIVLGEATGLALPLSAITTDKEGVIVRVVRDGTVHQVKIDTGIQDGGFIEVKSGVTKGDEVVAKAGAFVRNGDRVNPVKQAETQ